MNQFSSRTAAGKSRLEEEKRSEGFLSKMPGQVLDFGEIIAGIFGQSKDPSFSKYAVLQPVFSVLKSFATKRTEERFEYLIDNVSTDVMELLDKVDDLEDRTRLIEERLNTPRFEELLSEAAIQVVRANAKGKIERLSHVAVSGAVRHPEDPIEQVLEFERHAVELGDSDITMLVLMDEFQAPFRSEKGAFREDEWVENVRKSWQEMIRLRSYGRSSVRDARSSFARLQARGLIAQVGSSQMVNSPGTEPYGVLNEGIRFLQYLAGYKSAGEHS